MFVTHDLAVVAEIADRVVVMYGGRVVEQGGVVDVLEHPGASVHRSACWGRARGRARRATTAIGWT